MSTAKRSPTPEQMASEDPQTAAARKELRQTTISKHSDQSTMPETQADSPIAKGGDDRPLAKDPTPERTSLDSPTDKTKDQVSSPKKKRGHEEVEEPKTTAQDANGNASPIDTNGSASVSRTDRSEPQKKRARDVSSETKANDDAPVLSKSGEQAKSGDKAEEGAKGKIAEVTPDTSAKKTTEEDKGTTTSAFKSSGLSGFASQASPFLQSGDSSKPLSSFASPSGSQSPFGLANSSTNSTSTAFGSGNGLSNAASPFGQVAGAAKPFGSGGFGGGFGSSLTGSKLSNFGKPGETFKSSKPARPFGAPISDEEDKDEEDNESSEDNEKAASEDREAEDDKSAEPDDKKKARLQRVDVDDGEAGEATLLQNRARIYHLDKASNSWKERGAGYLKINVPLSCVEIDEEIGDVIPGSFDATSLTNAEGKVVRLIMRQDSTHRLILNTAVFPALKFQEKSTVKAVHILFTAIEDEGPVSIQMKMSPPSASTFLKEIGKVQRELQTA